MPRRRRLPNPYVENGKPIVVVVRGTEYKPMLHKGMEILGGLGRFGPNRSIQIKPNFIMQAPYPVTTDGFSILDTIEFIQKEGYDRITVAEWGSLSEGEAIPTDTFGYYELDEKAARGGFNIIDLYQADAYRLTDSQWVALSGVGVIKSVYDTDLIISMPVLKGHNVVQYTCALKNMMGQIDRATRLDMHRSGERFDTEDRSTKFRMSHLSVAEIASAIDPELTIIDARYVLGKSQDYLTGGIKIKADRLIISGNALAADLVAAQLLDDCYDEFEFAMARPHLDHAADIGFGGLRSQENIVVKEVTV